MQPDDSARLRDRENALAEALLLIEDPHERLAAIVSRARRLPALHPDEKRDAALVSGCQSRVWLVGGTHPEAPGQPAICWFRADSDSPMVKGLVGLLIELFDGVTPEVAADEPVALLTRLGLHRTISPTRLNGLAAVRERIRQLAMAAPTESGSTV